MKKLILMVLTVFIFVINVSAEETYDKLTVEELNIKIIEVAEKKYRVTESYNTRLIYNQYPSTTYFVKKVPLLYTYKYDKKEYSFKIKPELFSVTGKDSYTYEEKENNYEIFVGTPYDLLNEKENISITYNIVLDNNIPFVYDISNLEYDVDKVNFKVVFLDKIDDKLQFSLNGEKFNNTLDKLTYEIEDEYTLIGTYDKKLNANDRLRIMIGEPNIKEFNYILIYIPIGTMVILLLYVIVKMANRKI